MTAYVVALQEVTMRKNLQNLKNIKLYDEKFSNQFDVEDVFPMDQIRKNYVSESIIMETEDLRNG